MRFEVPRHYQPGAHVFGRRLLENDALYATDRDGAALRLLPVNRHHNATSGRARGQAPDESAESAEPAEQPPRTASEMAFNKAYPSLVDTDGGFIKPGEDDDDQ